MRSTRSELTGPVIRKQASSAKPTTLTGPVLSSSSIGSKFIFQTRGLRTPPWGHPLVSDLVSQLYGLPHGILHVFNTILYENEFQNPQILIHTLENT
jgi:hypothetical protein